MKISKNDLLELISRDGDLDHVSRVEVVLATQDNELEIEGYERVQWTRFDLDDESTYPPFGHYLCVSSNGGEVDVAYRSDKCTDEIFASLPHDMRYWRPLPKPPQ